jgi:hypothetical protein
MGPGRKGLVLEWGMEELEGDLAMLGNALVILRLVTERVSIAVKCGGVGETLLTPVLEDAERIRTMLRQTQDRIRLRCAVGE